MARQQILFVGGGNMARSLIGGLVADGYPADRIRVTDPNAEQRSLLTERYGVETGEDNVAAAADADVVVLAVKPQVMREVAQGLAPALADREPLVISVAAGIRQDALARWLDYDGPIVRCIPNTPALLQAGMTGLHPNARVTDDQRATTERILRAVGEVVWVEDETMIDAITGVSGSGPAYFFLFIEALEAAAVARGLGPEQARSLATATAYGAARMARESGDDPATLRANVTSKGGTTAAAIEAFEAGGLRELVDAAVEAARSRAIELGDELGDQ